MRKIALQLFSIVFLLMFLSCKKQAGEGGTSFIKGKVFAKYYDKTFYLLKDSAYAPDVDVYIIYGDESTYGDHQKTSYDGTYEFKYLRKGSYKVFAYTQDTTGQYNFHLNIYAHVLPIIKNVEISKNKQTVEVPDINVIVK
jgi:hypothetical protein